MKILVIYAHPEVSSLNGALRDHALQHLRKAGHGCSFPICMP